MTTSINSATEPVASANIAGLVERRTQIQGWLARLDEFADETPTRVAMRIRADYEERLRLIVEELTTHLDTIRADLDRAREQMRSTGAAHDEAVDRLEETRIRHRIGELDAAEWEVRRPELEHAVAAAASARDSAGAELERLEDLLGQLESPALPLLIPEPLVEAEDEDLNSDAILPQLGEDVFATEGAEPDLAFLAELDRAITKPEDDLRPKAGVKCPECGYTNDPSAWYCGVCGVDLA